MSPASPYGGSGRPQCARHGEALLVRQRWRHGHGIGKTQQRRL